MEISNCKYGESKTFDLPFIKYGATDYKTGVTLAVGDVKVSKDNGAFTNIATLPIVNGAWMEVTLSDTEMEVGRVKVQAIDQTATKIFEDTGATLNTDLENIVWDAPLTGATHNSPTSAGRRLRSLGDVVSGKVDDISAGLDSFITDLSGTQLDHYADQTLLWTTGNLAGMSRLVLAYNESTKLLTIEEDLPEAPADGDEFDINPVHIHPVSQIVKEVWDRVVTEGNHNIQNSSGKILRELKENPGYEGGFIYYDSVGGEAGNEPHVNGTFDKPVNNETDLLSLKVALKADQVKIKPGSTLPLTAAHEKQEYIGEAWTLELGDQSISGSFFHGATSVNGVATGVISPKFEDCIIGNVTMPPSRFYVCGYSGTFIAGSAGDFFFISDSHSGVAGIGTPEFDYGAAVGATNFNFRGYHGGMNIKNMKAGDNLSFDGDGQITIDASCTGGTMRIAGHQKITGAEDFIAAGGVIEDSARFATDQLTGIGTTFLADVIVSEKVDTLLDINKPLNLTVDTTTKLEYQWRDTDGDPIDISALTFKFKAVKNAGEASPAIPEVTGTIQDGPNGRWYFDVLPTTVFKGRYEIWAVDGASKITPLTMAGGVRIEAHPRL